MFYLNKKKVEIGQMSIIAGVPHLASETRVSIIRGSAMEARIMMFVVPGEHPNLTRTAETLAAITGGRVNVVDTRPYVPDNRPGVTGSSVPAEGKRLIATYRCLSVYCTERRE